MPSSTTTTTPPPNVVQNSHAETLPEPSHPKYELRAYGLSLAVTSDHLVNFFAVHARVLGVLLHPSTNDRLWAQIWVSSELDVQKCLELKGTLAPSGITLVQAQAPQQTSLKAPQSSSPSPEYTPNGSFELKTPPTPPQREPESYSSIMSSFFSAFPAVPSSPPAFAPQNNQHHPPASAPFTLTTSLEPFAGSLANPASTAMGARDPRDNVGLGFRHVDPQGPLPRNLYVMGLPLDMTQVQFKAMFTPFGMVEHSTLLSQLDGMGRRRGFVLMSTHQEAVKATRAMNGSWHSGFKMDVSWALVQREAKHFGPGHMMPNRVVHPPTAPARYEPPEECTVIVENLDPGYFPDSVTIRDIFSHFGPVTRVSILSPLPLQVLVQFDHSVSATALIAANGFNLGGRSLIARRYAPRLVPVSTSNPTSPTTRLPFDPFGQGFAQHVSRINNRAQPEFVGSGPFHPGHGNPPLPAPLTARSQPPSRHASDAHLLTSFGAANPEPIAPMTESSMQMRNMLEPQNASVKSRTQASSPWTPLSNPQLINVNAPIKQIFQPSKIPISSQVIKQDVSPISSKKPSKSSMGEVQDENKPPVNEIKSDVWRDEENGLRGVLKAQDRWQVSPNWCKCFWSWSCSLLLAD
ncbi:hypothetical protein L202_03311 [Cryptococcus amylolentus CBS 6039]|uniref:RRM domain-containing protein n=1 Tax=Cryptococcus amylolentus CBS 6039 TaxID=1295533 RepID=A0A1E3HSG4_9TREE|nr:hypothetical protein L202_03311 [Cryptococcus amylolentus CBS 6039]ODN79299.1 hypothetical protein L202_03311 [Cryptococcus amylolentus CBS 6039]